MSGDGARSHGSVEGRDKTVPDGRNIHETIIFIIADARAIQRSEAQVRLAGRPEEKFIFQMQRPDDFGRDDFLKTPAVSARRGFSQQPGKGVRMVLTAGSGSPFRPHRGNPAAHFLPIGHLFRSGVFRIAE